MTTQTNAAVSNAVQNTPAPDTSLHGKTLGEVIKDLDKGDLKQAYKAIDTAYDIQWGKDGINDFEEKLKGLQGKVGEQVYSVAKVAMEHCEDRLVIARSYFLALCSQAETHCQNKYIQKYREEKPIGQLIPLWSQYKSAISKGMEKGLNPSETMDDSDAPKYATAAQYRAAVQQLEKEDRATGSQAGDGRNSEGQTATQLQLVTKGWSPRLSAAMEVMCKALNGLTHEEQDKFATKILDLGAEITTYANAAKREAIGDTRTDNQKAVGAGTTDELDPGTRAAMQAAIDKDEPKVETKAAGKRKGARAA
jgi:hypothetical protein